MRPNELLDAAIKGAKLKGDADLCRLLNWASGKVSQYRNNKKWPGNNAARILAEAAGLDPLAVIAELEITKATDEATRTAWGKVLAGMRSSAVALVLAVFALSVTVSQFAPMRLKGGVTPATADNLSFVVILAMLAAIQRLTRKLRRDEPPFSVRTPVF